MALAEKIGFDVPTRSPALNHPKIVDFPIPRVVPPTSRRRQGAQAVAFPNPAPQPTTVTTTVTTLPRRPRLPLWIKVLVGMQRGSTVLTGGLMASTLVIYSWTVYVDKMVSRTARQLDTLQTTAQQITTANETLKHSMAQQAEAPTSGLQPLQPDRTIFLVPAPSRRLQTTGTPSTGVDVRARTMPSPLGY